MTPIDGSKIIYNPLITRPLIADTGAMTAIGVGKFGCGNSFHPKVTQILCILAQANFRLNVVFFHFKNKLHKKIPQCPSLFNTDF